jgi:hypothetical protein
MKSSAVLILLLALPLAAGAAQVTLSASTRTATIADPIELRVVIRTGAEIDRVVLGVPAGNYDVIGRSAQPVIRASGGNTFEEIVTIAFFKTGDFTVGPFTIDLLTRQGSAGREQTGQLVIRIRSILSERDRDIKPLKELLAIRGNPWYLLKYFAGGMLLLLLVVLGILLMKKMKKKRLPASLPPLPPEIELEKRLHELRQKNLLPAGEFRQFFIALSEMIKHFIMRAYGFNALDRTTFETVEQLEKSEDDGEIVAHLRAIFAEADLVKFARQIPETDTMTMIFKQIAVLIGKHKKRRELAEAEAHVQAGK